MSVGKFMLWKMQCFALQSMGRINRKNVPLKSSLVQCVFSLLSRKIKLSSEENVLLCGCCCGPLISKLMRIKHSYAL